MNTFGLSKYGIATFWLGLGLLAPELVITHGGSGGISHGGKRGRKHKLCVISVDGQDYRVDFDNIQAFLERKRLEEPKIRVKKSKKSKKPQKVISKPPHIVIKSAPPEYKAQIQASVDRTNEIIRKMWEDNLTKLINRAEQEEALALVLMMED
jgi:hypothetical protein